MNIVIVEDSALVSSQLARLIAREPRLALVGCAPSEDEAVELILRTHPDAVLLDLSLAPGSGLRVLKRIRKEGCGARVLILTNNTEERLRLACEEAGVQGFFDKTHDAQKCLEQLVAWLPPLPSNETRRMELLFDTALLDTPEQEVFDNLTRMAVEVTHAPVALISLVDARRQWFLSHTGTDMRETSRDVAFCAHAILHNEMMEVPDARNDPRFRDNPLVTGHPGVRFYAGMPLVFPSGEVLGTLCVIDDKPRTLSEEQRQALRTLARSTVSEIELRRRVRHLEEESERRRLAEARITHLATRDQLTGLPNRTTFRDRLDHDVQLSLRRNESLGVMFIDLDGFKLINDTLGHDVGDEVLVVVAERLRAVLRGSDTPARLGGDEFAALLPSVSSEAEALQVANKLVASLEQPILARGHTLQLGASIGAALFPEHGRLGDEVLRHADLAMYHAKENGGRRACIYSHALGKRAEERLALESDLQKALQRDEFLLHFQPQVMLGSNELLGVEALLRWQHPTLGLLPPEHFVALAQRCGSAVTLTGKALELALGQLRTWDLGGMYVPRISVNVPISEIRSDFLTVVEAALARHGIEARRLELTIPEFTLATQSADSIRVLAHLRASGISIAADDFGVGASSLAQLHRLPIDCLRIDRGFIQLIDTSPGDRAIVSAIVAMANALGLRTVAKGIERGTQVDMLQRCGCRMGLGFYICEPLSTPDAEFRMRQLTAYRSCA